MVVAMAATAFGNQSNALHPIDSQHCESCPEHESSRLSVTVWSHCSCPGAGGGRCPSRSPTPSLS